MPTTWQERLQQAERAAREGAQKAAHKAEELRQKAEPAIRDAAGRAGPAIQDAAERARPAIQDAVDKAKPVVEQQAKRGRAVVDAKLEQRKVREDARQNWFRVEAGPVYTNGYPDREAMRAGIQAAAEHGWRVETTVAVPEKRRLVGGLTAIVAKQAADRVLKPDRFLVTFRKQDEEPTADEGSPAPAEESSAGESTPAPDPESPGAAN